MVDADRSCTAIPPLLGHTIGVTGDRRAEELEAHLRSMGAGVLHGPFVRTKPIADDNTELRSVTSALIARPPRFLLATTGIGMRGWMNAAAAWGLRSDLVAALSRTKILARGPKVVGATVEAGLDVWHAEPSGQTDAMVERLCREPLRGASVAVQLPGADLDPVLERLRDVGADVTSVGVYQWTWPDDLAASRRLLRAIAERRLSAITFTSRPAVRNFFALARDDAVIDEVRDALAADVLVACIGQVTASEVRRHGLDAFHPAQPVLGMLVPTLASALRADRHHHLRTGGGRQVIVQHRLVHTTTASVVTSDREAALLGELLSSRAVTRERLLRNVWRGEDVDPSVVDTTVARLRRRLASTGVSVTTINGRGYMLDAERVPCV